MKQSVNFSQFCDAFHGTSYNDNFTYDGKKALFEHLEQLEEETGEEMELDIVALCCEYSEYADIDEYNNDYSHEYEDRNQIANDTTMIPVGSDGFIIFDY